jgi:hypothetical protein
LNELQVVFQEASAKGFNEYSKGVFDQLSRCHTAKMGYHRLRCDDERAEKSSTTVAATGIVRIVADSNANSGSITE